MKIAYVTIYDALNVKNWSGAGYYMANALKNESISLDYIGALTEKNSRVVKAKKYLYRHVVKKRYLQDREPIILRDYARQVTAKLAGIKSDVVFSPGSIPIAYLDCHQPIVFWTDATFAGMVDYYPSFTKLCPESIRNGNKMEQSALDRARLAIYSSDWAAQTAIANYHIDKSKIRVVPFGANIECNRNVEDIKRIVDARPTDRCKLLFLAVDWNRKGGGIALEVARELNRSGLRTELSIVGCRPTTDEPLPDFVQLTEFISKSTTDGLSGIAKLLADSHFLILPSRADCCPIVLSEACSFGVPCLSTNVGGIPTVIKDGVNGKTFAKDAPIEDYCAAVAHLFFHYQEYRDMALSAFNEYRSRLNWSVAAKTVRSLLSELPSRQRPTTGDTYLCAAQA